MTLFKKYVDWIYVAVGCAVLFLASIISLLWYVACTIFCIIEIWAYVMIQAVRAFAWEICAIVCIATIAATY